MPIKKINVEIAEADIADVRQILQSHKEQNEAWENSKLVSDSEKAHAKRYIAVCDRMLAQMNQMPM